MGEKGKKEERRMSRVERFILYTGRPDTGDMGGGEERSERGGGVGKSGMSAVPVLGEAPVGKGCRGRR